MACFWEYDSRVKRLNLASIVAFASFIVLALTPGLFAQVNGVPSSVTSIGFGGNPGSLHGTAPSVTSLGPRGYTPGFSHTPGAAPPPPSNFGVNPGNINDHHHPHNRGFYPWAYYAVPSYGYYDDNYDRSYENGYDASAENGYDNGYQNGYDSGEQYNGGPTVFDRRGPGSNVPAPRPSSAPAPEQQADSTPGPEPAPASDQPSTVLVFKDGHQVEVANYAIVGNMLYDLSDGRRHKIALADLDLTATAKQNEDRGLDFQVPAGAQAN
jgi:hypothetical protein